MIDTYKMLLWARPNENPLDIQAEKLFEILTTFGKFDCLRPRYQTVRRKKDAVEFDLNLESVKKLIVDKRDKQFPDLGSMISFFTSLNDADSARISISIGVSNSRFVNSLVVDLNWDYKKIELRKYDELQLLFEALIVLFEPFFGCITSRSNSERYDDYFDEADNKPSSVFDMNYFGQELLNNLRISDETLSKIYACKEIGDGCFIRLLKEPLDVSNVDHMELQEDINHLLGIGQQWRASAGDTLSYGTSGNHLRQ